MMYFLVSADINLNYSIVSFLRSLNENKGVGGQHSPSELQWQIEMTEEELAEESHVGKMVAKRTVSKGLERRKA